jgi:hypothetical protein
MVQHLNAAISRVVAALRLDRASVLFSLAAMVLSAAVPSVSAVQVHVPEGTLVPLELRNDVTTETVNKGDRIEFDVSSNVVVNDEVVFAEGARAWGIVEKVKGAGRKDTRDASVTYRLIGVRAADGQPIPLRLMPSKSKKPDPADNDIEESSMIPGPGPRRVGAPKGKQYAAYTDSDAFVNATASAAAAAQVAPVQGAPAAAPQTPPPAVVAPPQPASVDFRSVPTGGDVVIDGSSVGVTPTTLQLSPGLHDIEIHAQGYQNWKRKMRVEPGSHPTVMARLLPS